MNVISSSFSSSGGKPHKPPVAAHDVLGVFAVLFVSIRKIRGSKFSYCDKSHPSRNESAMTSQIDVCDVSVKPFFKKAIRFASYKKEPHRLQYDQYTCRVSIL